MIRMQSALALASAAIILAACAQIPEPAATAIPPTHTSVPSATVAAANSQPGPTPTFRIQYAGSTCEDPFGDANLLFTVSPWTLTDFCMHSVEYSEIFSGGPPPDGIPAIDSPVFETTEEADNWLGEDWPVMVMILEGDARAYPLAILIHHEIVNDRFNERPVAVTFCPLCNSTIAFESTLADGTELDFGTSGNLRNSDLIMYDRQSESWWQQFTGEAIVGEYTGTQLEFLPSQIVGWSEFKSEHPEGKVLSRDTGAERDYGVNPYQGYDSISTSPWFPVSSSDGRLLPKERVIAFSVGDTYAAYPFTNLAQNKVANVEVEDQAFVIFWQEGTISTFGISDEDTGSAAVFSSLFDSTVLTFEATGSGFQDEQTGSSWNIFGEAIEGELEGAQLEQVITGEHFWFAWAAFRPDTIILAPGIYE